MYVGAAFKRSVPRRYPVRLKPDATYETGRHVPGGGPPCTWGPPSGGPSHTDSPVRLKPDATYEAGRRLKAGRHVRRAAMHVGSAFRRTVARVTDRRSATG